MDKLTLQDMARAIVKTSRQTAARAEVFVRHADDPSVVEDELRLLIDVKSGIDFWMERLIEKAGK